MKEKRITEIYDDLKRELPPNKLREFLAMEKAGLEEAPSIARILRRVQGRMGVVDKIRVQAEILMALNGIDMFIAIGSIDGPELVFSPGVSKVLDEGMLSGVIAHELGHYINGDTQRRVEQFAAVADDDLDRVAEGLYAEQREEEWRADAVAVQFGYGRELRRAFEFMVRRNPFEALIDDGLKSHPKLVDRIRKLREEEYGQQEEYRKRAA